MQSKMPSDELRARLFAIAIWLFSQVAVVICAYKHQILLAILAWLIGTGSLGHNFIEYDDKPPHDHKPPEDQGPIFMGGPRNGY